MRDSHEYGLFVQSDRPHHEPPSSWIEIYEGHGNEIARLGRRILAWWSSPNNPTHWEGPKHRARANNGLRQMIAAWDKREEAK